MAGVLRVLAGRRGSESSWRYTLLAVIRRPGPGRLHCETSSRISAHSLDAIERGPFWRYISLGMSWKESKPIFGNPAKLDLLPSNSRWLCDPRSREVCRLSIRFKETRAAWQSKHLKGGSGRAPPRMGTWVPNAIPRLHHALNNVNPNFAPFNCSVR